MSSPKYRHPPHSSEIRSAAAVTHGPKHRASTSSAPSRDRWAPASRPLATASTHIHPDATRTRKLLLHRRELDKLIGAVDRKGYTLAPLALYWSRGRAKLKIGLAKGKKEFDKRAVEKERDWQREKQRIMKIKT